ncbi:hypothetical protein DRQ36_01720 [bacterium]|nr:MAG: hypothetical protein DRQ36_01720 [bacterium]
MNTRLKKALKELYSFIDYEKLVNPAPFDTSAFDLDRFRRGLAKRNNPHLLYPSVLIAGSKGKGSVASMVESILRAAGYSTGLYTSPHLVDTNERIRINGKCVPDDLFASKLEELIAIAQKEGAARSYRTVFEILTASAFELFAERAVDIAVVEVGIGGRLDATNVLNPIVTVITAIGLDHTSILGGSIEEIAAEKAGVMRAGTPVIIGPQTDAVANLLCEKAEEVSAKPALIFGREIRVSDIRLSRSKPLFSVRLPETQFENLAIGLLGEHQIENAALAVAAVTALCDNGFDISDTAVITGLRDVIWPGRMQLFPGKPLLIVDGAHSPMAVFRLVETIRKLWPGISPVYVFAANKNKNIKGMLDIIAPNAQGIVLTRFDWPRAAKTEDMMRLFPDSNIDIYTVENSAAALQLAEKTAGKNGLVVAAGSLYLAGEILESKNFNPCEYFNKCIG